LSPRTHRFDRLPVARSAWRRLIGLIGVRDPERLFLLIPDCTMVHTAFMRSAIDILFLDREQRVVRIARSVAPWRMRFGPSTAAAVLELPPGYAERIGVTEGDAIAG
jgi:uncharacterized membrane protein (UPF0127 family)